MRLRPALKTGFLRGPARARRATLISTRKPDSIPKLLLEWRERNPKRWADYNAPLELFHSPHRGKRIAPPSLVGKCSNAGSGTYFLSRTARTEALSRIRLPDSRTGPPFDGYRPLRAPRPYGRPDRR